MRKGVSEQCWTEELWRRQERALSSRKDAALQYAASFHCLEEWKDCEARKPKSTETWIFVNKKREAKKHQTERCVTAKKYRCMRCGVKA